MLLKQQGFNVPVHVVSRISFSGHYTLTYLNYIIQHSVRDIVLTILVNAAPTAKNKCCVYYVLVAS